MLRAVFALVYDLLALVYALLTAPARLLDRRRPFWIALELRGDLPWRAGRRGWKRLGRRSALAPTSMHSLARRLGQAGADRKVRGVVIKVEDFTGAGVKLAEIGRMVERLREAGKQVVFYGRAVSMREYALMAAGDRIQLAPGGRLDLKGYAAQTFVLGEVLARAGVGAHFLRRSEYKTAPELFTDSEVSAAQKETLQAILEELYRDAVGRIARGRCLGEDEVRALVDDGPYTAARAHQRGLIDAIGDGEDLETLLAAPGEKRARLLPVGQYRGPRVLGAVRYLRPFARPRVALVRVDGVIKLGESVDLPWAPRAAGSDTVVQALRRARADRRVRAIVLHVDSRGGSSLASELILQAARRAAAEKPVVAFVDQVAASGGYMVLLGCGHTVISPTALTGSIGVFTGKFELSGLLEKLGVGHAVLRIGRNAGIESSFEPWSEGERAALEREVEEVYRAFLDQVAAGRHLEVEQVEPLAGGRVYTGRRAHELGLVDELGGFEDAVRKACGLAKLEGEVDVVPIEVPAHALKALSGPRAALGALQALVPIAAERTFALAPDWSVEPRP